MAVVPLFTGRVEREHDALEVLISDLLPALEDQQIQAVLEFCERDFSTFVVIYISP